MEELQPSTPSPSSCSGSGGNGSTIQSRFEEFCKNGLSMDDKTLMEAIKLFDKSKHLLLTNASTLGSGGTPEEAERYWFAFVLFSMKRLSQTIFEDNATHFETRESGFTLCQILSVAKLNAVDFFKELPQYIVKVGPILSNLYGADWESRLEARELQTNFVHLSLLSKYYNREFGRFFRINDNEQSVVGNCRDHVSDHHRFGWLLFLALRAHAFSRFKDLVTCTNGLVSILAILIIHIPVRFRKFSIKDSSQFVTKGNKGVDLIASLCNLYETSEDELKRMMEKANNLIADILKIRPCLASDCQNECLDSIDPEGLIFFKDLFEESSLPSSLSVLEKDYDDAIRSRCELDERLFIDEENSLLVSSSLSGGAINMSGTKRKIDFITSPTKTISGPLSPYRSPSTSHANEKLNNVTSNVTATPVSTAMTTAKWLRTIISPLPSKPSAELERFLSSCEKDVTADVVRRAQVMMEAIFPSSGLTDRSVMENANLMDNIWTEQRRSEALKLYYRVLQAMCTAEAQILHVSNLTSLLTNERFHRCMLACSAELVLATHKTVTMLFPAVLERTGITAFDLSKVIESFIRHEESLPRELKRHLNSLEERLLQSMVWEKGSSMYNSLTVARPALSEEINRLNLLAEPMLSLDEIAMQINMSSELPSVPSLLRVEGSPECSDGIRSPKRICTEYRSALVERNSFRSPVKDRLLNNLKSKLPPPLQSAFASPTRPNPGGRGETCAETAINMFFGKIVKLAAVRISGMVERLQLSQEIRERVYCLFQQILSQRTALFFNHHIDQILLCCFYGVAKISQLKITFREIVSNYRKQPHCKPQVFRSVFVDWSATQHNEKNGKDHVDIITFYNEVFVPCVKPLLVELASVGTIQIPNLVPESRNNSKSPCPASPKLSQFPSLPDMSPKKVSAVQNVYVSQIRSPKMDAIISHSSKSYYACVGESTHPYQSPSKDLTAINKQLNNGTPRKIRGALNFDDGSLVSDSIVANSIYLQNRTSCTSSSNVPLKSEQPET